jgi:hypothetical protein
MLAEGAVGSYGAPENNARLRHRRGHDVGIVALLRRTPVERLLSATHTSRAAFMNGAAIAKSKKPSEVWSVFSFLAMDASPHRH